MGDMREQLLDHAARLLGSWPDRPAEVVSEVGGDGVRRTGLEGPSGQAVLIEPDGAPPRLESAGSIYEAGSDGGVATRFGARMHLNVAWRAAAKAAKALEDEGRSDAAARASAASEALKSLFDETSGH
jgi:hypothetical protein